MARQFAEPLNCERQLNEINKSSCATRDRITDWKSIDFKKVIYEVKRLQIRIAKAVRARRWGLVKSLQHILTNSFYAKLLAVYRVVFNKGSKTAGVDNIIWKTEKQYFNAASSLKIRGYKPLPLRRIYILKKNGKKRPLSIPTLKDRAMQALFKLALEPIAETTADLNSYGFRVFRSCADAIGQCFLCLVRKNNAQWIFEADIKSCFDQISHKWILDNIPIRKNILNKWLKAGYIEDGKRFSMLKGTPQGGIISPTIMNMVLDGLETELRKSFPAWKQTKVNFIRYADDFVITAPTKDTTETINTIVRGFLKERGLTLSADKTKVSHINEGFDFLSQNIRKYNGKLLIKPSKDSIRVFKGKIKEAIRNFRGKPAHALIRKLNPIIRGWSNYHKMVVSKDIFFKLEKYIHNQLWRWAKYNHSGKGKKWIWNRYFKDGGIFSDSVISKKGLTIYRLYCLNHVPIRRHIKIRGEANPFNPAYDKYFETRKYLKMKLADDCRQKTVYLSS